MMLASKLSTKAGLVNGNWAIMSKGCWQTQRPRMPDDLGRLVANRRPGKGVQNIVPQNLTVQRPRWHARHLHCKTHKLDPPAQSTRPLSHLIENGRHRNPHRQATTNTAQEGRLRTKQLQKCEACWKGSWVGHATEKLWELQPTWQRKVDEGALTLCPFLRGDSGNCQIGACLQQHRWDVAQDVMCAIAMMYKEKSMIITCKLMTRSSRPGEPAHFCCFLKPTTIQQRMRST